MHGCYERIDFSRIDRRDVREGRNSAVRGVGVVFDGLSIQIESCARPMYMRNMLEQLDARA